MYRLFSVLLATNFWCGILPRRSKRILPTLDVKFLAQIGKRVLKLEGLFVDMGFG